MRRKTELIAPATVPDPHVTPVAQPATTDQPVSPAVTAPVPAPEVQPVIPEQLSAAEVAVLREENRQLREELSRVRQR